MLYYKSWYLMMEQIYSKLVLLVVLLLKPINLVRVTIKHYFKLCFQKPNGIMTTECMSIEIECKSIEK